MTPLDAPVAIAAVTHGNIETTNDGPPDDLFLILGLAAFRLHAAAAMRAALRQRNRNLFLHALQAPFPIHDGIDIILKCDLLSGMFEGQSR